MEQVSRIEAATLPGTPGGKGIQMDLGLRLKIPVLPSVVRKSFPRPDPALVSALQGSDISVLSGLVGRMYTMTEEIRSLFQPAVPMVGVATTVKCPAGDNLAVFQALSMTQPGDILVIDAQGFTSWCLGGFQMLRHVRERNGLAGIVVNGAYRDIGEAQEASFPIYGKAISPVSGPKFGPGEINVTVCCGAVIVEPGDVIAANGEGIVVIPRVHLQAVVERYRQIATGHHDMTEYFSRMGEIWASSGRIVE